MWEVFHDGGYQIQDDMEDPVAFVASSNPDIMYYLDQAMKEPDKKNFEPAMLDEVKSHTDIGHWEIVERRSVPSNDKILPSVWAMRRKRRISTGEPYKWKARLNVHGGKQEYGLNFWETYSPVVSWTTTRLFLVFTILNGWKSRQVDFVLTFPQADLECPMYMEIPRGFRFKGSRRSHCGKVALMFYVDDGIFVGPTNKDIDEAYAILSAPVPPTPRKGIRKTKPGYPTLKMTDEGDHSDYLGVKVDHLENGTIKLSQPHLIKSILDDLGFNERTGTKTTLAACTVKLNRDLHGLPFDDEWHYRSVIGKLNFLEKSTRLDIVYSVHQCSRFSSDPKASHATAVKRIGKYLLATKDKGLILNPRKHSFDCWVDADFVGKCRLCGQLGSSKRGC
jgi:hypothetical protein